MKLHVMFRYLGILSGIFGLLLMIGGVIGYFTGGNFLGVRHHFNWFYIANTFLFLGMFMILVYMSCPERDKKE